MENMKIVVFHGFIAVTLKYTEYSLVAKDSTKNKDIVILAQGAFDWFADCVSDHASLDF